MTPRQLLDCAQALAAGPDEAHWRAAVSRGYYAAFHATAAFVRSLRFLVPPDASAHRYLTDRLGAAVEVAWVSAGNLLGQMRKDRTDADYDLAVSFGIVWAERFVLGVEDYFDLLDQLRGDPALLNAVQAIRTYEQGRKVNTYAGP